MRLTWLAALAGIWTVSYLCIRQYGKGLPGSLARSVRRAHRPIIALSLLACSGFGEHDTCMVPAAPPAPSCKRSSAVSAFPALAALIWSLPVPY